MWQIIKISTYIFHLRTLIDLKLCTEANIRAIATHPHPCHVIDTLKFIQHLIKSKVSLDFDNLRDEAVRNQTDPYEAAKIIYTLHACGLLQNPDQAMINYNAVAMLNDPQMIQGALVNLQYDGKKLLSGKDGQAIFNVIVSIQDEKKLWNKTIDIYEAGGLHPAEENHSLLSQSKLSDSPHAFLPLPVDSEHGNIGLEEDVSTLGL